MREKRILVRQDIRRPGYQNTRASEGRISEYQNIREYFSSDILVY